MKWLSEEGERDVLEVSQERNAIPSRAALPNLKESTPCTPHAYPFFAKSIPLLYPYLSRRKENGADAGRRRTAKRETPIPTLCVHQR